jgi:hypothetical protein
MFATRDQRTNIRCAHPRMLAFMFAHVDQFTAFFIGSESSIDTSSGSPTKVTTVRLVALPGATFSKRTPSTSSISFVI